MKTYKYLIKLTKQQEGAVNEIFRMTRFVHNKCVEERNKGIALPSLVKNTLQRYCDIYPELRETDTSALMHELFRLHDEGNESGFISSNAYSRSYSTAFLRHSKAVHFVSSDVIYLPKVGNVKIVMHRPLPGDITLKTATVVRSSTGDYYICINFEHSLGVPFIKLDPEKSIGFDYSSTYFIVDNNGTKYYAPKLIKANLDKISKLSSSLRKVKRKSETYQKRRLKYARLHEKIYNQRRDYLHKLSTRIANEYDYVFVEDIDLEEISQKDMMGRPTKDNAYGTFIKMLDYKMRDRGKKLIKVDRYFPSTKMCSDCGYVNKELTIDDREWICPRCGTKHERDVNAAINIRKEGLSKIIPLDSRFAKA